MAEGWARHLGNGTIDVRSAGIQPFMVHPLAIATMEAAGIDISRQRNNRLDDRILEWADWVITLSDTVKPYSAYFPRSVRYDHWSIPNPDTLVNTNITPADAYARIRDKLKQRIEDFLGSVK
jgi:arsenate reductase